MNLCTPIIVNISIVSFLIVMIAVFGLLVAVKGMPERMERSRSRAHPAIGVFLIEYWMWLVVAPLEAASMKARATPTAVTYMSLFLHFAGGAFIALGRFTIGGWLFLAGATFDILDGRMARLTGRITKMGAYLDSVLDRYGEMATLLGFGFYYYKIGHWGGLLLAALVALGAMMVSYTRSRAESLGATNVKGGFMQRPERAFFIGIVTGGDCFFTCFLEKGIAQPVHWPVIIVLGFVALAANITAVQRIFASIKEIGETERKDGFR